MCSFPVVEHWDLKTTTTVCGTIILITPRARSFQHRAVKLSTSWCIQIVSLPPWRTSTRHMKIAKRQLR